MSDKPKRNRLVVDMTDEDREWIRAQAESTGWGSEALVVRMLIKDAREKGLSFAVVASGPQQSGVQDYTPRRLPRLTDSIRQSHVYEHSELAEIDAEMAAAGPVDREYLDNVLADRLNEVGAAAMAAATEPWPEMTATAPNGNAVAVSLEPAPKRDAKSYR